MATTYKYTITAVLIDGRESLPSAFGAEVAGCTTTSGFPTTVRKDGHGYEDGDLIYGFGFAEARYLNNNTFVVSGASENTFALSGFDSTDRDSEETGGTFQKAFIAIEAADELNEENYVDLGWQSVKNAVSYNIYRFYAGGYSFINNTRNLTYRDDGGRIPDVLGNPPYKIDETPRGFPVASAYHHQRRIFDAGLDEPDTWIASRVGDQYSYAYTGEVKDDSPFKIQIASAENTGIRHIVAARDLVFLTADSEWVASSGDRGFTPTTITMSPQTQIGCSAVRPLLIDNKIIFERQTLSGLFSTGYNYEQDSYISEEITLYSRHLFRYAVVRDMVHSTAPDNTIIVVMSDGLVNILSYYPVQEVEAWSWFETDGEFESVAFVPNAEIGADDIYFVVKRNVVVDGVSHVVRGIEILGARDLRNSLENAFFVDSGLSYFGPPTDRVFGLSHLRGKNVVALADGGVVENLMVDGDGAVTLPLPASVIHVGLPFSSTITTLNPENPNAETLQGTRRKIPRVTLRLHESKGFKIRVADGDVLDSGDHIDEEGVLFTGDRSVNIQSGWETDSSITIEQDRPLPLELLAIVPEFYVAKRGKESGNRD